MDATENKAPTAASPAPTVPQRRAPFLSRLLSSIVLWALVLLAIFQKSPIWFYVAIAVLSGVALWEFYTLLEKAGQPSFKFFGVFGGCLVISLGWYFHRHAQWLQAKHVEEFLVLLFVLGVFLRQLPQRGNVKPIETMSNTLFGILYIPWLLNFITKIAYLEAPDITGNGDGRFFVLYLILVTKFSDVGAYVIGSLFGRHKMAPTISPNKTWEGAVGAILVPLGLSLAMYWAQWQWLERLRFTLRDAIILGVLLGFIAVLGDLAKSLIKRQARVKDSGHFIPGIGGALDLVDSLLFTAPIFYMYLRLMLGIPEIL
jgi:phosphatidate cytidylyltransferase